MFLRKLALKKKEALKRTIKRSIKGREKDFSL